MNEGKTAEYRHSITAKAGKSTHHDEKVGKMNYGTGTQETDGGHIGADAIMTVRFDHIDELPPGYQDYMIAIADSLLNAADHVVRRHIEGKGWNADIKVPETEPAEEEKTERVHPYEKNPHMAMKRILKAYRLTTDQYGSYKDLEKKYGKLDDIPAEELKTWLRDIYYKEGDS